MTGPRYGGFERATEPAARRDFFDIRRLMRNLTERVNVLEQGGGGGGPTGTDYVHIQSTAASVWTIDHNMGFWPNVTVVSSGNDQIEGDVEYTTINQVVITFSGAFAGRAFLS